MHHRFFLKTALAATFAVLSFLTPQVFAQDDCMKLFHAVQETYENSNIESTVIDSSPSGMKLYSLAHFSKGGISYTSWKSLDNEIAGYALRNDKGFDYNSNRSFIGPLAWHQTLIWDKIFSKKNKLNGYECTLIGRSRLAGRKVSVLRLNPIDEVRYSFLISKDDDTSLPVELAILSPNKSVTGRFTISAVHSAITTNLTFPDETFDRIEQLDNKKRNADTTIWSELTIPNGFKLVDHGVQQENGNQVEFQTFSDGLVEFMVYKNTLTNLLIHTASEGTLTIYRKNSDAYEYAVVGEIPVELCAIVLSKIASNH